jgi:hypothetical protein
MALDNIAIKDGNANLFTLRSKDVSPAGDGSLQASLMLSRAYPLDYGNGGMFQHTSKSLSMEVSQLGILAPGTPIYAFRWPVAPQTPPAVSLALIRRVTFHAWTLSQGFSAGMVTFDMFIARSFTAQATGEITVDLTGNNAKLRASMASSLAQIQHSKNADLTPGTRVLDPTPIETLNFAAPTTPWTAFAPAPVKLFEKMQGEHPFILAQNEGFVIQQSVPQTPAGGAWTFAITCEWDEVPIF